MNLTDFLYDNLDIFSNIWYHRLLAIVLLAIYFCTDRFSSYSIPRPVEESTLETETDTSDFISESESEPDLEAEKTLIKNHFKILNDIQATKFKCKNYTCSYHYYCINNNIKLECCFCKICGNYICSADTPAPKIMCSHYKLIDSVDSRIDIFSGHIRTDDEQDVRNTINSFFETSDELEMEFYKSRLRQFVCDEIQTNESDQGEEEIDSDSSTTQT